MLGRWPDGPRRDRYAPRQPFRIMRPVTSACVESLASAAQIHLANHILACQPLYGMTLAARIGYK